ncbi:MAG: hypothetical protein WAO35_01430 [Terriglobia bacterium]
MSAETSGTTGKPFALLLLRAMAVLAAIVLARLVLELSGVPHVIARYVSSTVALPLVAIYVAAVGPLRGGLRKFSQHLLPALILAAWTEGWLILVTVISAVLRLSRSHYAVSEDYGNWSHLGRHVLGHTVEIGVLFVTILLLMTVIHILWRWPVTVAPGAMLGVFVIVRFWTEAMGVEPFRAAAWSSTILVLLSAFYLGAVGAWKGLTEARQLLAPSLVLGWVWRLWVYLAMLLAVAVPYFPTHFFDVARGHVALRLLGALAASVVEGFLAGLIVWGIAVWIWRATQPVGVVPPGDSLGDDA